LKTTRQPSLRLVLAVAILGVPACATVGERFRDGGLDRAAFELQCPREQLQVTGLNRTLDQAIPEEKGLRGTQIGVTGCGKRAVYIYSAGAGWVANTAAPDEKPAQP